MNRSELGDSVAIQHDLSRRAADAAVNAIFATITGAIVDEERVEIRGFGSFTTRTYAPYVGRNPRTGEPVQVAPKRLPYFKVGKDLRIRVDHLA